MIKTIKSHLQRILRSKMSQINVDDYVTVKEGKATILSLKENKVFYNPIQQFNRDLSVTAIRAWSELYLQSKEGKRETRKRTISEAEKESTEGEEKSASTTTPFITILEALSATGLRAIRYGHEIPLLKQVVANDLLPEAVKSIDRNIEYNNLKDKVSSNLGDAIHYMSGGQNKFHVVDLDPYGTATPFIDGALQSINEEGLLLVTCTDAGVLAGSGYPEKCFALYGGNNFGNTYIGGEANHEAGLRLILHMIATNAAKYKKTIEPLLSLSIDFYMRVFIRVKTSPMSVKHLASSTMITYHCVGCGNKLNQFLGRVETKKNGTKKFQTALGPPVGVRCEYCTSLHHLAGPMWGGPLHNHEFIDTVMKINDSHDTSVYGTTERIRGMVTVAKNELLEPFYFNLNQLSSYFKSPPIPINDLCKAIGNLGYDVSLTHAQKNCIKTTAPWNVVLQINRQWLIKCNKEALEKTKEMLETQQDEDKKAKLVKKIESLENDISMSPNLTEGMVGYKILSRAKETLPELEVNFDDRCEVSDKINKFRKLKIVRYQENPTKNWGPKSRPSS